MTATRDQDQIATLSRISDADAANRLRPDFHAELLEEILAIDPNSGGRDPGDRHPATRRARGRRPLLIAGLAAVTAAALILIVPRIGSDSSGPGPSPASAAVVVKGAIASLATRPNTIVTTQQQTTFALGKQKRPEVSLGREIDWIGAHGIPRARLQTFTFNRAHGSRTLIWANTYGSTGEFYDSSTGIIYKTRHQQLGGIGVSVSPDSNWSQFNPFQIRAELAAQLESMMQRGTLKATGSKMIDGQQAVVLTCANRCHDAAGLATEYDVARGTHDLLSEVDTGRNQSSTLTVLQFRTETATPVTERQFELTNTYPNAKVVWLSAAKYRRALINALNAI